MLNGTRMRMLEAYFWPVCMDLAYCFYWGVTRAGN